MIGAYLRGTVPPRKEAGETGGVPARRVELGEYSGHARALQVGPWSNDT
jgi:hypothetical protein